jgi:hypothetical protein
VEFGWTSQSTGGLGFVAYLTTTSVDAERTARDLSGRVITETLTTVTVGDPFRVRLQSIGPGEYERPPTLSSPVVQYLGVSLVTPHVPAGVTQEFAFRAVATGRAIVTFHHTGSNPPVADTLDVE